MPSTQDGVYDLCMGYETISVHGNYIDVDAGEKMAINIFQWCRDICSWTLINGPDIKLGGTGQIVQIDESTFTHQGKVFAATNFL